MPITYTNRKGLTYYLCKTLTKSGKSRYVFTREPKGEPVEQVPEGYAIRESVNGVVSLVKERPMQIRPEEIAAVERVLARHPSRRNYRVSVKPEQIEIYERVGADPGGLVETLRHEGLLFGDAADKVQATMDRHAQFSPIMRFTLLDADRRQFGAERWCFLGSIDDWIRIDFGPIDKLAQRLIPKLGSDEFFELF